MRHKILIKIGDKLGNEIGEKMEKEPEEKGGLVRDCQTDLF